MTICERLACGQRQLSRHPRDRGAGGRRCAARFPGSSGTRSRGRVFLPPEPRPAPTGRGTVLVVCAGTSDLPVAEEAAVVAEAFGHPVERMPDVGVAGLHRLLAPTGEQLRAARW